MENKISRSNLLREYDLKFADKKEKYKELFNKYIIKGAFPELLGVDIKDNEFIKKYIKESVVEKSIVDIARLTHEDEKIIYDLFRLLANSNARLFEIINLSSILKINRNLTSQYINLLEKAFLITISYNYTASIAKQIRASKKEYIAHSAIVISILDYPYEVINTEIAGHLVEGLIANTIEKPSFWRTPQKNEVDLITRYKLPIEVKYQSQITGNDLKNILRFFKKFNVNKGIVITKDTIKKQAIGGTEIFFIPAWLFLLIQNPEKLFTESRKNKTTNKI